MNMDYYKYSTVDRDELMVVDSTHLIARYNRALHKLQGKQTSLSQFHIDCTGYSPEIAEELNDIDYLSPDGISKQFIIISIGQEYFPIARCHFSSTYDMFRRFFKDNRQSLVTLTSLDSVYGEMENNIYKVESIQDVVSADTVRFLVDTPKGLIAKSKELTSIIKEFVNLEEYNWIDDDFYLKAIGLANQVGNVNHNQLTPSDNVYCQEAYYTSHFGGLYVFKEDQEITLIFMDPDQSSTIIPAGAKVIDGTNIRAVHSFLLKSGFIENTPPKELDIERLRIKKYHVIVDTMVYQHHVDKDLTSFDDFHIKQFVQENYHSLPSSFHQLKNLVTAAEREEELIYKDDYVLFYTSRITDSSKSDTHYSVLNHLIANYTPHSYLRLFTFNRELFTEQYSSWPTNKQQYVDSYITDHIQVVNDLKRRAEY